VEKISSKVLKKESVLAGTAKVWFEAWILLKDLSGGL